MRVKSSAALRRQLKYLRKICFSSATLLAKPFRGIGGPAPVERMSQRAQVVMSLHGRAGRKYLNVAERRRFAKVLRKSPPRDRLFCLVLMWSGARISEVCALAALDIDLDSGLVELETLKRRAPGIVRQVPLPRPLLQDLNRFFMLRSRQRDPQLATHRLWPWSRVTAWRRVKAVMKVAGIQGGGAMPKGLRHTFGVAAFQSVPPHIVQRWLGHASLRTTAIYGDVSGPEEELFAQRLWKTW